MNDIWSDLQRAPADSLTVAGVTLRRGSRVRLHPRPRGDMLDRMLDGKLGIVEGFDETLDDHVHIAVTIADDPGRDMGEGRYPGHRFFFSVGEIEPVDIADATPTARTPRILVAGIGNMFLGDDGFGVEVARTLADLAWPHGVDVRDFGIRGMDLAYAMQNDYDAVVFVDAAPRGAAPGTLSLIDARVDADGPLEMDTHGMDPVKVLAMARALGRVPSRVLVVACEPASVADGGPWSDMDATLSAPVRDAIPGAVAMVQAVVHGLIAGTLNGESV